MKIKRKGITTIVITIACLCLSSGLKAQEVSFGADIVSIYLWRGAKLGNASVQPSISAGYKGLSLTAWGSTDFTADALELDLTLGYSIGQFSVAVTDYFATSDADSQPYFRYQTGYGHVFEGTATYTVSEKLPLTFSWNTYFAGTDNAYKSHDYSTYIEAAYAFTLWSVDMSAEMGLTPWKGAYADGFHVVNIALGASREIPISSKFSLPVFTKVAFNPADNRAFIVFGLSLSI